MMGQCQFKTLFEKGFMEAMLNNLMPGISENYSVNN
jgi:hypothetical protein